jgi:hypothetical protein
MYPTQAKKRLEWATVSFVAALERSGMTNLRERCRAARGNMRKKRIKRNKLLYETNPRTNRVSFGTQLEPYGHRR